MIPENPVVGGTVLRRASIESPNHVPGVSGWSINQDGSVEFNSGTFRGQIVGGALFIYNGSPGPGNPPVLSVVAPGVTQDPYGNTVGAVLEAGTIGSNFMQIDQSGNIVLWSAGNQTIILNPAKQAIFTYSPTAGASNLIASMAANSGTDSFGNQYLAGVTEYNPGASAVQLLNGQVNFYTFTTTWVFGQSYTGPNLNLQSTDTLIARIGALSAFLLSNTLASFNVAVNANSGLAVTGGLTTDTSTVNTKETVNNSAANQSAVTINQGPTSTNSAAQLLIILTAGLTAQQLWLAGRVSGDTNNRISLDVDSTGAPRIRFGPGGSTAPDVILARDAVGHRLDLNSADLDINTVGRGLMIAEGTNARMGTATLAAGSAIVANTSVTANTRIFLTTQVLSGTAGALRVGTVTPGSGFGVNSSNAGDNSTFAYLLVEPG